MRSKWTSGHRLCSFNVEPSSLEHGVWVLPKLSNTEASTQHGRVHEFGEWDNTLASPGRPDLLFRLFWLFQLPPLVLHVVPQASKKGFL